MKAIFIVIPLCMFSNLYGQSFAELYYHDLPNDTSFRNNVPKWLINQELSLRFDLNPENILFTFQYLQNRYQNHIMNPDSNGKNLVNVLDKNSIQLADKWARLQLSELTQQNLSSEVKEYVSNLLKEKTRGHIYFDSVAEEPVQLLDSNRASYLLLKYYLGDSSLVYKSDVDYSHQRNEYELQKISKFERLYEIVSDRDIFEPDSQVADAKKYFFLFKNYYSPKAFQNSYLGYAEYISKLISQYDQSFRPSLYFARVGYLGNQKQFDFTSVLISEKEYPVTLSSASLGTTANLTFQAGRRIFLAEVTRPLSFIDFSLLVNIINPALTIEFQKSEHVLKGSTPTGPYSSMNYYSTSTNLTVSQISGQIFAVDISTPLLFISNRALFDLSMRAGIRKLRYEYAGSYQMEQVYEDQLSNTYQVIKSYSVKDNNGSFSKNAALVLLGLDFQYYLPVTLFGPQLGASASAYFGSAFVVGTSFNIYF